MRFGHRLPQDTATLLLRLALRDRDHRALDRLLGPGEPPHRGALERGRDLPAGRLRGLGLALPPLGPGGHRGGGGGDAAAAAVRRSPWSCWRWPGVGAAFVSDWFIHALDPAVESLGISKAFAGLVIVAIAGNAVENFTGIFLAAKGKSDLAISVVKNSVAQIAAFLFPALVLVSLLFTTHLTFALAPVYIGALFLTALAVWQITGDGEAQTFEGLALIAIYVVLAAFTLYE